MEKIRPMLFTTLKKYSGAQLMSDVVAGIIVAIIALPLSIALALASGVGPEQGIYTAIAAGFVISFLGGSQVQIAGPTAAFATIVAGIVAKSGVEGLAVATIMAGIILVIMGFCHFGSLIKFIPFTITTGFTSGIAVTIVIGQLKDFFGVTYPAGMETIETMQKLKAFAAGFGSVNLHAIIVGVVCLAILIVMPMITEKIPGSLVAVIGRYFNGKIPAAACEYDRRPLHGQQQASGVPSAGVQLRCDSGFPVGCVYDCSSGGD